MFKRSRVYLSVLILVILIQAALLVFKTPHHPHPSFESKTLYKPITPSSPTNRTKTATPPTSSEKFRRFALIAVSIHSKLRSYTFYLPITAAAWQRIGYKVIVVFVGDFNLTPAPHAAVQLRLARTFLQRLGAQIIHFQCPSGYSIKISQIVRIFAGFLPSFVVADEDLILTTDSDIIPMRQSSYEMQAKSDGFIFNAFCCGVIRRRRKTFPMYPMSHICLRKSTWRDLFLESVQRQELLSSPSISPNWTILLAEEAPLSFDLISLYTRHEFRYMYDSKMIKGDFAWHIDQTYVSMLLDDYMKKHAKFQLEKRRITLKRLDSKLPLDKWKPSEMNTYGDAHLWQEEIFAAQRWNLFKHLLNYLFNSSLVNDFELYQQEFVSILNE